MRKKRQLKKICAAVSACVVTMSGIPVDGNVVSAAPETEIDVTENPTLKLSYDSMAGNNHSGNAYDQGESFYKALPIGNGRVGAMVYGNYPTERFELNEATFWSGGPGKNDKTGAAEKYQEAYQMVLDGKYKEADDFISRNIIGGGEAKYQSIGTLELEFGHDKVSEYSRELDMNTGIVSSDYTYNGVKYHRESFVSHPDEVLVTKITSEGKGAVSFTAKYSSSLSGQYEVSSEGNDTLVMNGRNDDGAGTKSSLRFQTRTKVIKDGGDVSADNNGIVVEGADSVVLITSVRTNFVNYEDCSGDEKALAAADIENVADKSYEELYNAFVADYQELFHRVDLQLGDGEESGKPMRQRIQEFADTQDPDLVEILFQYGRYLMICGSRDSQPLNLQGIWNKFRNPAWDSKYTTNINYEMNYWPALTTNLEECFQPFVNKALDLSVAGNYTARNTFGIENGWVVNHNTDLWNRTGPIDGAWGLWPTGGGWISNQLYDAYNFNQDPAYLSKIYPVVKGSADFLQELMVTKDINGQDYEVLGPSNSPEIGFWYDGKRATSSYSVTMDNGISRELFQNVIEASEELGIDAEFREVLEDKVSMIRPDQIGASGTLQEWAYDWENQERQHRHISHLYNLFPGSMIDKTSTPLLAEAVQATLNERGDEGTGWSEGWKLNTWARLEDGNHAYNLVKLLISPVDNGGRLYDNLWDAHPPFQIDGNFGFTSGIAEMLLQSQNDEVNLLPAIPDNWSDGHVSGLRARGNFTVSESWSEGSLDKVVITSGSGNICNVRYGNKTISFPTVAGKTYTLDGNLEFAEETKVFENVVLGKSVTASNETDESAANAVDGDTATQWEDLTNNSMSGQWLTVDLGNECDISRWRLRTPGEETTVYAPRNIIIQKSDDGNTWEDVDTVYGNQMNVVNRSVETFTARYVRICIDKATQDNSGGARISEFELWGTDESVPAETITLDQTEVIIEDGSSVILTATVGPDEATNKTVVWTSDNEDVATVSGGVVTSVNPGTAVITAATADGTVAAQCTVTVSAVPAESIVLDKNNVLMEIGSVEKLKAIISPENTSNTNIIWTSSDDTIATVDGEGQVEGLAEGTVTITATTEDGRFTATCEVKVVKVMPRNVALNATATANSNHDNSHQNESPEMAVDGNTGTKWCCDSNFDEFWLKLDLGAEYTIDKWVVVSAGISESTDLNTKDCRIQISENGEDNWQDIDVVTDNTETILERSVEPFTARYVRLFVDEPTQPGQASYLVSPRIHEFELWGIPASAQTDNRAELEAIYGEYSVKENDGFVKETWEAFQTALENAAAVINNPDADKDAIDNAIAELKAANDGLRYSKNTLEYFLNLAEESVANGEVDGLVESVKELFLQAVEEGRAVMDAENPSKDEITTATLKLAQAIHSLEMIAGDKTDLEMALELAEMIDLTNYVPDGQEAFLTAVEEAKTVMENPDAFQEDVNTAWNALLETMSALRMKANKDALNELLKSVESMDLSKYTDDSVAVLLTAIDGAKAVVEDETLDVSKQAIVDEAYNVLLTAKTSLKEKEDPKDPTDPEDPKDPTDPEDPKDPTDPEDPKDPTAPEDPKNPTDQKDPTTSGNKGSGSGSNQTMKPVKTGDHADMTALWTVLFSGAIITVIIMKRRKSS